MSRKHRLSWARSPGLVWLPLLVTAAAMACGATTTRTAVAHDDPCHAARTCPSDDHSYVWSGMSCTSDPKQRLPEDQTPIDWRGVRYWCHVVVDTGMGGGTPTTSGTCAADRAAVRTLRDADASSVRLSPVRTTVARLWRIRFLASTSPRRRAGAERTVYRVHARLLGAKLLNRSEWQLTVGDLATGATLLAGFPATGCPAGAPEPLRSRMAGARAVLIRSCGLASVGGSARLRGTATLDAVGFVPSVGTKGAGRVHVELRPVLRLAQVSCRRVR